MSQWPPQQPWQDQPNTSYQQPSGPYYQQPSGMYPPQYQQPIGYPPPLPPKKKSHRGVWIVVGILAVVMLFSCVSIAAIMANAGKAATVNTSVDTPVTTMPTEAPTTAPTTAPINQHFKVGQVVNVGSVDDVTINNAKTDKGGAYNTPQKAGDVYLVLNVTVKNIAQQEQDISSLAQFNVTDSTGQKYDVGFDTTVGASLDGKVEPGETLKGSVVYEVPGSVKSFVLYFQTDLFTSGQTEWDIQV